jgi:hypothetical protein
MVDQISASDLVHQNLQQFARSMVKAAHPSAVDGLKPVLRRIIDAVRDTKGQIKSLRLVALTIENHPHGDDSIYDAAARLGQTFEYNPTLLTFDSAVGTYNSPRPADKKYTKEELSAFAWDVFFEGIEYKAIPKQVNAILSGLEPIHLVPAIPTALLFANSSIGYGESSYTVSHNLADVCDLVVEFCRHQKTRPMEPFDHTRHTEKFLPDFPSICTLTNYRELLAAYKRGRFTHKIRLDGEVELTAEAIHIKALPYGVPFKGLDQKIEALMSEKGSWFDRNIQSVMDISKGNSGDVCVKLKRGVNAFEAWELLRKKIMFSGSVCPIANYNDGGYVVPVSQPNLLQVWYAARYNILVSTKKLKITKLTEELRKVEARLIVCDHIDAVLGILRGSTNKALAVERLQASYDLTLFQAEYLAEAPLHILTTSSKPDLLKRKTDLETSLRELRDSFGKIPDEMAAVAQAIKKKYPTPRRTKIPAYVGYVRIGGGCIQIDTVDEIPGIIEAFPKDALEIYIYDGPFQYRVTETGKLEMGAIPKITTGDIYGLKADLESNPRSDRVITVNFADGAACCVKGFIPGLRKEGYFYTTPRSKVIQRNGVIRTVDVASEFSLRKTICRGAATDVIYVYPEPKGDHYVIALNTTTPNVIAIQRVSPEKAKIAMNPKGTVRVVHCTSKHFFLNIPPEFLNRNTTRVVEFIDLDQVLAGNDQARLDIGTTDVKKNKHIRLL